MTDTWSVMAVTLGAKRRKRVAYDRSAAGVADENDRSPDPAECADGCVPVAFQRVQSVLSSHHVMASARSVGINLLQHEPSAQRP